jgi:hypothetical protein
MMNLFGCCRLPCTTALALGITSAPAFADGPETKPGFAGMDNTGDGSKLNLDGAVIVPTHGRGDLLFRSSLLGQYVAPDGVGGYMGISAFDHQGNGDRESGSGIGNLELGGLYHRALSSDVDLGVRVGFILPTASDNSAIVWPADVATAIAGPTWLRLGLSPTFHDGPVFARIDFGVDVPLSDRDQLDPLEHFNVGIGIGSHGVSATAELQTIFAIGGFGSLENAALSFALPGQGLAIRVDLDTSRGRVPRRGNRRDRRPDDPVLICAT